MARRRTRRLLSLARLQGLLATRSEQIVGLVRERQRMATALHTVERTIKTLCGRRGGSMTLHRRRPRNTRTLGAVLVATLKRRSGPMSPVELTEAVHAAGYKSSSKNLRSVVYQALRNSKQIVHANGRGTYRLKAGGTK